jgi:hypothetical protein
MDVFFHRLLFRSMIIEHCGGPSFPIIPILFIRGKIPKNIVGYVAILYGCKLHLPRRHHHFFVIIIFFNLPFCDHAIDSPPVAFSLNLAFVERNLGWTYFLWSTFPCR